MTLTDDTTDSKRSFDGQCVDDNHQVVIPAHLVDEHDKIIAFFDIIHTTPGHLLVAGKLEHQGILDLL